MTTLRISLMLVETPPNPNLPTALHTMAELMPAVLAAHGLSMPDEPRRAGSCCRHGDDYFEVVIAALESALAS